MYRLQFYRSHKSEQGYRFRRDSGYGVYINGVEYALAKTPLGEWDVTETSTGMLVNEDRKTFPTRELAYKWLKNYTDVINIRERLEKPSKVELQDALKKYKRPAEVKTHEKVGNITLTVKQADFLTLYKSAFGTDGCIIKEIADKIGFSPMTVGALMSTLVEKGVFCTQVEGGQKKAELTDAGLKIIEEV